MTEAARLANTPKGRSADAAQLQAQFTQVYRQELPYVWRVLSRLGAKPSEREDLAHDVFAVAYRQWEKYDPTRPLRPWLFGIAYRVTLDFKRKHSNRMEEPTDFEQLDVQDAGKSVEQSAVEKQGLKLAAQAMEGLELDRRAVFIMHEIDGCPIPEVAEVLGIPLNTAYSRLRLARRDFNAKAAQLQRHVRAVP